MGGEWAERLTVKSEDKAVRGEKRGEECEDILSNLQRERWKKKYCLVEESLM